MNKGVKRLLWIYVRISFFPKGDSWTGQENIMTKEEILHLGQLSRIQLTEAEVEKFRSEIDDIITYVSTIDTIVADYKELTKKAGPVHNVFREDEVTNEPGTFTSDIVEAFPVKQGKHLQVKKILTTDE